MSVCEPQPNANMSEPSKSRAGIIYNVVESVVLLFAVGLTTWTANTVITHGNILASHSAVMDVNTRRLEQFEVSGSRGLGEHEKEDNTRIEELKRRMATVEAAIVALQTTPGELKAISARLDSIREGQGRIEKALEEHLNKSKL